MKESLILFYFIFLWINPIFAQKALINKDIDSLFNAKSKIISQQSKQKEDSLQRELLVYKTKESYYNTILGFQSGVFFTIIGGLIGLIGVVASLITWSSIKTNRELYEQELQKMQEVFKEQDYKNMQFEYNMAQDASFLYLGFAHILSNPEQLSIKFSCLLSSMLMRLKVENMEEKFDSTLLIGICNGLKETLEEIIKCKRESVDKKMIGEKENFLQKLDRLLQIDNQDFKTNISKIRVAILDYYKEIEMKLS